MKLNKNKKDAAYKLHGQTDKLLAAATNGQQLCVSIGLKMNYQKECGKPEKH